MKVGRPKLALGTVGRSNAVKVKGSDGKCIGWRVRARVRDFDGTTREIDQTRKTRGAAEQAVANAARNRHRGGSADVTPETTVEVVAEAFYQKCVDAGRAVGTLRVYRSYIDNTILPTFGNLSIRELTPGTMDRTIKLVKTNRGSGAAATLTSILRGICTIAVINDATEYNAATFVERITKNAAKRDNNTPFHWNELSALLAAVLADDEAVKKDLPELMETLSATGLRISETLALEWSDFDLDHAGTITVGTKLVIYRNEAEAYIQRDKRSSKLTQRVMELPTLVVEMLRKRKAQSTGVLVFPHWNNPTRLRDPNTTGKQIKAAIERSGVVDSARTSRVFRNTMGTLLNEAGIDVHEVSLQLGDTTAVANAHYVARRQTVTSARTVMDQNMPATGSSQAT